MKYYRTMSLLLALTFVVVGFIFLFLADGVLEFFNSVATLVGMKAAPVDGVNFYLILATGYMYLVSLLAFLMFRQPKNPDFPLLLTHAKLASSVLSLGFFLCHQPYLIYLTNCLVDGSIGGLVLLFYLQIKKSQQ
ncbi:hypothetical protein JXJ21_26230 [candidate division KSB1 bacterium]|nr:hypothetical protein [candidate division KSB1 bacterium]